MQVLFLAKNRSIYSALKIAVLATILTTAAMSCGPVINVKSQVPIVECPKDSCVTISGKLSDSHVEAMRQAGRSLSLIVVDSMGGKSSYAFEISEIILEQQVELIIVNECSSACFEFLVPAARSVRTVGQPIVAVHGSPLMTEVLLAREGIVVPDHCYWPSLQFQKRLYKQKNLKTDFTLKTIESLGHIEVDFSLNDEGCLASWAMTSEVDYWQPNSSEVEDLLGVTIQGGLCRDARADCLENAY